MAGNSKNQLPPNPFIVNGSMASTFHSLPVDVRFLDNVCIQLSWPATGAPNGTFTVEASLDYNPQTNAAGTWDALQLSASISATGGADSAQIDMTEIGFPYLRVTYVPSSGTGTLSGFVSGKAI